MHKCASELGPPGFTQGPYDEQNASAIDAASHLVVCAERNKPLA